MATRYEEFLELDQKALEVITPEMKKGVHLALLYDAVHSSLLFPSQGGSLDHELEALSFILKHQLDPFDDAFLKGIHAALKQNQGCYRDHNVHITYDEHYYFPPSAQNVEKEMKRLFEQYPNLSQKESFEDIFVFTLKGLLIHPFPDGNGRTFIFALQSLLQRLGLTCAPYLPLDALHNGLNYKITYRYLFHAGGFYYGQKTIHSEAYIEYAKSLLTQAYEWLIQSGSKIQK